MKNVLPVFMIAVFFCGCSTPQRKNDEGIELIEAFTAIQIMNLNQQYNRLIQQIEASLERSAEMSKRIQYEQHSPDGMGGYRVHKTITNSEKTAIEEREQHEK